MSRRKSISSHLILFVAFLFLLLPSAKGQAAGTVHLSKFSSGRGPVHEGGTYRLLHAQHPYEQSNAIAFDLAPPGRFERLTLRCQFRVAGGGKGGAFILLNTAEYGRFGPAPFVKNWTEPNLVETFAVGIDVHNPPTEEPFGAGGNYQGHPEREISLHWDGREIVKRVAQVDFRDRFTDCETVVRHVIGGAEVTVRLAGQAVYENYFIPGMLPYESRLAMGAGGKADSAGAFDVRELSFSKEETATARRDPWHIGIFNHVMIDGSASSPSKVVRLPPSDWAFGRVILTLEIHDAGSNWDEWDRAGHLYVIDSDGEKHDIAPFVTSFRTPFHRKVDVTHFRSWLSGRVPFEIEVKSNAGKNLGYMMSASLDFYHGIPKPEPYRIISLWEGTAQYGPAENHFRDFFKPQTVPIDDEAVAARLFIAASGHSPVGEFTPSPRTVVFIPDKGNGTVERRYFEDVLWKTDGYLNPNRPQFGTWKYERAGWAPGDMVHPWWIDLTDVMIPGTSAELRYEPEPYDFSFLDEKRRPTEFEISGAIQIVRAYLILYREPGPLKVAPFLEVIGVEENSNAAQAGIQVGDYLESYQGRRLDSIETLRESIQNAEEKKVGQATVVIHRGTELIEKPIATGRMGVKVREQ